MGLFENGSLSSSSLDLGEFGGVLWVKAVGYVISVAVFDWVLAVCVYVCELVLLVG